MLTPGVASALVLIVAAGVAASVGTYEMRGIRRRRFAERAPLGGDAFFDAFYRDSGLDRATVIAVRRVVAHAAELPEDVLRPSDRFDHELSAAEGWETWWDDGVLEMKQRGSVSVAEKTRSVDWGMVTTLDDLVRQVAGANRDLSFSRHASSIGDA